MQDATLAHSLSPAAIGKERTDFPTLSSNLFLFLILFCDRHILSRREGDKNNGHLGLYLEIVDPESLPQGWKRDVKFSLTLVTKACGKSSIVLGNCFHILLVYYYYYYDHAL